MKKYIWLYCIILLIVSCGGMDYPLDIEFEIEGTRGLAFWGWYRTDTLGGYYANDKVPTSYNLELNENETAECSIHKVTSENEDDTLIVSLYVDAELFATETTITYNPIQLLYP